MQRATKGRIDNSLQKINSYLIDNPDHSIGTLSKHYWETTNVRKVTSDDSFLQKPNTIAMDQLQHIDQCIQEIKKDKKRKMEQQCNKFQKLEFEISGQTITWNVNVIQLREMLGLPSYPLVRDESFIHPSTTSLQQSKNIEDVDHQDDNESGMEF